MVNGTPTPRTVRHRQPLRLFCVEYEHGGKVYVNVVEANCAAVATYEFTVEHPNVKVVRVY